MKNLAWGLPNLIPDDAPACWGARAILKNGVLDFMYDRVAASYVGDEEKIIFVTFMEDKAMPWLDNHVTRKARGDKDELFSLDEGKFHVRANTNASHGYLYVTAWMEK